jgi:hypothetical protein
MPTSRAHLPMVQVSTYGKEPYYQLTCGAVLLRSMILALAVRLAHNVAIVLQLSIWVLQTRLYDNKLID